MSGCERFERFIEDYLGGDISPEDLEQLEQHSLSCPGCRMMMELHRELSGTPEGFSQATEQDFDTMRTAVLRRVGAGAAKRKAEPFWKRLLVLPAARPAYAAVSVVVLIALGFLFGRMSSGTARFDDSLLVNEVIHQASLGRGLEGYWESPFTYSNVNVRGNNGGNLILSFDVTRRVDVATTLDSPLAREVLAYAMIDPSNMGSRLKAVAVAGKSMDKSLRDALVFVLLNDPSMPVRLRSIHILSQHASDPVVQDALLAALSQDPSVQVRLLALESLAGQQVAPDAIRRAIGETPEASDRAVLNRAIELMGESS
jgi:predicted anti-sigma-YlaC factor YlaD